MAEQEIVIKPAGPDKPGYLRRVRKAMGIQQRMANEGGVEAFDEMIDFLLAESDVTVPKGVDPREALMDLSQDQYNELIGTFSGTSSTAVDPQNGA